MLKLQDRYVRVFHGVKTLEYDLALHPNIHTAMLSALAEFHPQIAEGLVGASPMRPLSSVSKERHGAKLTLGASDLRILTFMKYR